MKRILRLLLLFPLSGYAAIPVLSLPQAPLFSSVSVPPNVFFLLDDSGSMDWEVTMQNYWGACAYNPLGTCKTYFQSTFVTDGSFGIERSGTGQYVYVYNTDDNVYDINNAPWFSIPEFPPPANVADWRVYSSDLNITYYNPDITYSPWPTTCNFSTSTACPNASFSAARSNPVSGLAGYSLSRNLVGSSYEVWIDDKGFTGTQPSPGNVSTGGNGLVDLWDSHITLTFNTSSSIQVSSTSYLPSSSGLNPSVIVQTTLSGGGCYNVLGPTSLVNQVFSGALGYNSTGAPGCLTVAQAQQNFANFYQYARRRHLAAKGGMATVISLYPDFKYAFDTINDLAGNTSSSYFVPFPASGVTDFTSQNDTILSTLLGFAWRSFGTPTRVGLDQVGQYYSGKMSGQSNPIYQNCQQNYTIVMTDGLWNESTSSVPSRIYDVDGDGFKPTLADVARYYYITNLNSNFTVAANAVDPATYPHMDTFTIAFGLTGALVAGPDGWPTPTLTFNSNWGNPMTGNEAALVDDLWHAAFNGFGQYFGAQNPALLGQTLGAALVNIASRNTSASSASQNSTTLNANATVYQSIFQSSTWTGDVLAYSISNTGVLSTTPLWSASCMLSGGACTQPVGTSNGIAATNRVILSRDWTGVNRGIAFRWPNDYVSNRSKYTSSTNINNFLSKAPFPANTTKTSQINANNTYAQNLLNYIRGDQSKEAQNGGSFRNRTGILGDIVDSSPIYVPAPYRFYPDSLESSPYSTFKNSNANRTPLIYVGANDGMLHSFNALTGLEVMAYVPGANQIYDNLPNLSVTPYAHNFFSNATPAEADVFYNGAWHTILVSTLGNGGQSLYALDITDPTQFSEARASSVYLFEFSDLDSPDMGYVQGTPVIGKVRTGAGTSKWAIIFGNGYNNAQSDLAYRTTNSQSTTGYPALYILFIESAVNAMASTNPTWTGSFIEIKVPSSSSSSPNGLSTPYAVDINGDYVIDYVYAGDLQGNMWRFDLTNNSQSSWAAYNLFTAYQSTTGDQPITAPPVVGPHPNGIQYGVMVYFGTGRFLQSTDNTQTNQTTQTFYGIWDKLAASRTPTVPIVAPTALVSQQILGTASSLGNTYRLVSSNSINWNPTTSTAPQNLGWALDLIDTSISPANNYGERQVTAAVLRANNVVFSTLIPDSSSCGGGGSSWIMEVSSASGGAPNATPFDVTGNGLFNALDQITVKNGNVNKTGYASGVQSTVGVTSTPTVFMSADKSKETKVLSGSKGLTTVQENPGSTPIGRQNWRQINN